MTMTKQAMFIGMFFSAFILIAAQVQAAGVTLAWDPSEGEVKGYRIYYGTQSHNYTMSVDAGNVTQFTVSGLDEGKTYYFVVRAYNEVGESGDSNEVTWTYRDTTPPLPPSGVEVK